MTEKDLSINSDPITRKAKILANRAVKEMNLPIKIDLPPTVNRIGAKLKFIYERDYSLLIGHLRSIKASRKVAEALKCYWTCCYEASEFVRLKYADLGKKSLTKEEALLTTAQGYADLDGWAFTFYNGLVDGKVIEQQKVSELLGLMALYWLYQADNSENSAEQFDFVAEALCAMELSYGHDMWDGAIKSKSEAISIEKSLAAKKGHRENYEMKSQAKEYWLSNIDLAVPNDAAAIQLMKIVPLSLRTLSSYVSEFKREMQPASKV